MAGVTTSTKREGKQIVQFVKFRQ